jgi:hypothetical protein
LKPLSTEEAVQRLLSLVEAQSETIEIQGQRIQRLEELQSHYVTALNVLESRIEKMVPSKLSEGQELEDDDGQYVEV